MTEQETQSNMNGQPEQTERQQAKLPEQTGRPARQEHAGEPVQPIPRTAGGRRPLFRSN